MIQLKANSKFPIIGIAILWVKKVSCWFGYNFSMASSFDCYSQYLLLHSILNFEYKNYKWKTVYVLFFVHPGSTRYLCNLKSKYWITEWYIQDLLTFHLPLAVVCYILKTWFDSAPSDVLYLLNGLTSSRNVFRSNHLLKTLKHMRYLWPYFIVAVEVFHSLLLIVKPCYITPYKLLHHQYTFTVLLVKEYSK